MITSFVVFVWQCCLSDNTSLYLTNCTYEHENRNINGSGSRHVCVVLL